MRERPRSILWFERLFLTMIGVTVVRWFYSWLRSPLLAELPESITANVRYQLAIFVVSVLIHLLLWYLVVRRASTAAKWIIVALAVINLIGLALRFYRGQFIFDANGILTLIAVTLYYLAVGCLFRRDAKPWFDRSGASEADVFR